MSALQASAARTGGGVVVESLEGLGAEVVFGVPGIHSLAIWDALRTSRISAVGTRTELSAGFAADGYARSSGRPAPLLLSTGPGALNSLTALMEAASSHVPVVAISSQIPRDLIGRGRGYLHELHDQLAVFAPIVKYATRAESASAIADALAHAWKIAVTPPSGPVFVEIPVDVLIGAGTDAPASLLASDPALPTPEGDCLQAAAELLSSAERPVIWAGGGTLRSDARRELRALAEMLEAPVATTYMGKGALGDDHPLAAGCGCDEAAFRELLADADVVLCVGSELGAETTSQYRLRFSGKLIQIDAAPERVGTTYPAMPLIGDAKATLTALLARLTPSRHSDARERVARVHSRIHAGLELQQRETEIGLLAAIARALPEDAVSTWDMTILSYWAAPHLRLVGDQQFLYPLGSGTLGYAWPAAIGAAIANRGRAVLAVVGDGGFQYALAELASARQHSVQAKLLLIDDGGYGILREYQREAYGETTAVDLVQPDFAAVAESFGVPARTCSPETLGEQLEWALSTTGPAVVILKATIAAAQPTR